MSLKRGSRADTNGKVSEQQTAFFFFSPPLSFLHFHKIKGNEVNLVAPRQLHCVQVFQASSRAEEEREAGEMRQFLLGVGLTCICFSLLSMMTLQTVLHTQKVTPCAYPSLSLIDLKDTTILLWTPIRDKFSNWNQHFGANNSRYLSKCSQRFSKNVSIVTNRNVLPDPRVKAILFNLNDLRLTEFRDKLKWMDEVLPPIRRSDQIWILFWREPPSKVQIEPWQLSWLDQLFNWTVSYRRDSTLWYPFGQVQPSRTSRQSSHLTGQRSGLILHTDECQSESDRLSFLREMVDLSDQTGFISQLYGRCANKIPKLRPGKTVLDALDKQVLFCFAAETEICDDYVTDLYFDCLRHGMIPIVFGGTFIGYDEAGLAGTYVNALDFASPQALVGYLKTLESSTDSKLLWQHLSWTSDFQVVSSSFWVCELIKAIFAAQEQRLDRVIMNFTSFWTNKRCYGAYYAALNNMYEAWNQN